MMKQPTQQRASEMVAVLVEAAALEIGERGLDALTTNHVARRAGVSVGSLYQYFANKEMIVEALLMQRAEALMAVVHQRVAPLLGADIGSVTRAVLEGIFEQVEGDAAQRELLRHWHRLNSAPVFQTLERQMAEICRQYLLRHFDDYRIDNLPAVLFVVINSVQYTTARYLGESQPLLGREDVIDTLARMVESLCASRPRSNR
ncbi:TetR/AcrR family transcriptional regulator [Pseudomonas sp. CAN2814]|uniref:TetR/AcrR family transcriptional regulator n=1 Tax=Pseudomonas sp. CAN1 TaxID=3046726 RepID=UPI0026491A2A|nr:TetR/AcrR family transcriptional regulator [Pseudomonas sp. CAN1]MDN6860995.1 TetR/AcrR family transcriptional regulator [Pseudomonas sp. CAN1]